MANIKISQLTQYDGSDYSKVDVAGVDRQEGVNVKVNLAPVNEIKNKVSDNTVAQGLTAGFAQMLLGNETPTEQSFVHRKAGGDTEIMDGSAQYTEVRGESVVWNQLVNTGGWITSQWSWVSRSNPFEIHPSSSMASSPSIFPDNKSGHKMMIIVKFIERNGWGFQNQDKNEVVEIYNTERPSSSAFLAPESLDNCKFYAVQYDLTMMFGAGNEPATYEEFLLRKPLVADEYAYNEGTIINNNVERIKTKDSDGTVIGEISVKPHYIEGGLKSAGSVYDSKFADKEVQRVGVVDLGSLSFTYVAGDNRFATLGIANVAQHTANNNMIFNAVCSKYYMTVYNQFSGANNACTMNESGSFSIRDNAISPSDIGSNGKIEKLNGVMLYYQLATPIAHTYEQADNTSALIKANGTEEAISSTPSTPVKVMARYSIDVYQAVKDLLAASQAEPQAE